MTLTCSVILIAALNFLFSSLARIPTVSTTMTETVTKCKGDNFMLKEPATKITAQDVNVFRNGEFVANTSVHARGELQNRLIVHSDGSVELINLTSSDFGEYLMRVKLSSGETKDHMMRLVVREPPETTDGRLSVTSDVSNNTFVRLTCGTFTSLGYPSLSVIWKDPVNQLLASTGFSKQFFTLDLPVTVARSGNYCCQIDCRDPGHCCLDDQSPLRQCAMFEVHTGKKKATLDSKKCKEGMSLVNVTGLVQRVSQIYNIAGGLEISTVGLACSDRYSGAMVISSVGADNWTTVYSDMKIKLDRTTSIMREKVEDIETALKSHVRSVQETCNEQCLQTDNDTISINSTLQTMLSKLQQTKGVLLQVDYRLRKLNDKVTKQDAWNTSASFQHDQTTKSLETIMQGLATVKTSTVREISTGCQVEKGYRVYNELCLKLYGFKRNYHEAKARCQDDGTHLFHFKSRDLDTPPLLSLLQANGRSLTADYYESVWVGADDLVTEGLFLWSDGTPLTNSGPWDSGEPNNEKSNEDCVHVTRKQVVGLNDFTCHTELFFVCQADITPQ